jgi:pyridinium-3,5-bisthiocarboxylic acid mononucleotide nickel chelatase
VLSAGPPPAEYVPLRSGYGAGTKDPPGRANALRIVLADVEDRARGTVERLVVLAADVDDMGAEYLAEAADRLRAGGALDVVLLATLMKKGRPGTRLELLVRPGDADRLEDLLLAETTTIGVRRLAVERRALPRVRGTVEVLGYPVAVKLVTLPGGTRRAKPEFDDVRAVAERTGQPVSRVQELAARAAERLATEP